MKTVGTRMVLSGIDCGSETFEAFGYQEKRDRRSELAILLLAVNVSDFVKDNVIK